MVSTINPSDKPALKRFVSLERKLMQAYPKFISEIDSDLIKLFSKKLLMSKDLQFQLFIASKNGEDVARCAAIINPKFQAEKQPGSGFIGFFAAAQNCAGEVADMIEQAENWLKQNGVTKVIAPSNGGAPQAMGFLATGFDEDPMFPFPWHPPYYQPYIEHANYQLTYPLWYYDVDFSSKKYKDAKLKYADNHAANIRTISKKHWNDDIEKLIGIMNETFKDEWEFTSMDPAVMKEFFVPMKPVLDPRQILFAEKDGRIIGFCLAFPDLTPLFRSFNGKVGLFAIFKILTRAKKFKRAGILGIGVLDEYKGKGISKALAMKLYEFHESLGMKSSLYYPVNEVNGASRGFAESIGGKGRVMYRVYSKAFN